MVAGRSRHVDVDYRAAALHGDLQGAVVEVAEHQQPVGVPRAELEAERYGVVSRSARQLKEAGGVEEDWEGVSLHAGEGQVTLWGRIQKGEKQRQEVKPHSEIEPEIKANLLNSPPEPQSEADPRM